MEATDSHPQTENEAHFSLLTCLPVTVFRKGKRKRVFRWSSTSPVLQPINLTLSSHDSSALASQPASLSAKTRRSKARFSLSATKSQHDSEPSLTLVESVTLLPLDLTSLMFSVCRQSLTRPGLYSRRFLHSGHECCKIRAWYEYTGWKNLMGTGMRQLILSSKADRADYSHCCVKTLTTEQCSCQAWRGLLGVGTRTDG